MSKKLNLKWANRAATNQVLKVSQAVMQAAIAAALIKLRPLPKNVKSSEKKSRFLLARHLKSQVRNLHKRKL